MKNFLLVLLIFLQHPTHAQPVGNSPGHCGRAKDVLGGQQISYYQYPSMNKYDIKYLKIDLSVEPASRLIAGSSRTVAQASAVLDSFIIELKNSLIVDSVLINGTRRVFSHSSDHIFVPLLTQIAVGEWVQAEIYYRGTAGSGIFSGTVASNGLMYTATVSESYQAREWFPAKQILSDKIDSADLYFTTASINKVGSNGLLQSVLPVAGGKVRYHWKEGYPMNYYMPSFSVGNYMEYKNYAKPAGIAPDSLLVQHYIVNNPTYFGGVKANLDKTPPFIEKMSELFGNYPFANEKYGHAHASIGGGMEHQTMSTMAVFTPSLIAHELGHQWWGDNVTCASWNDIWLNEGFATYSDYLMTEKLTPLMSTTPTAQMQSYHNSVMSAPGGSVYVPNVSLYDESRIFSQRLSYNKGAAVIHTLRFELQNDNLFFESLKNYQQLYKNNVASTEDFKTVVEQVSARNFSDFFNQWVYGEGFPTVNVTYLKEGSGTLILRVSQTVSMPAVTPFFKGLYEFRIQSLSGDTTIRVALTENNQEFRFAYNKIPTGVIVDPNNWVINGTGSIINGGTITPPPTPSSNVTLSGSTSASCGVALTWITKAEHNISKYQVEFSSDSVSFIKVAEVAGTNTNNDEQYTAMYTPTYGNNHYFRLKIYDTLSNFRYSNTIRLQTTCLSEGIAVGPVPTTGDLSVFINAKLPDNAIVKIYNLAGQLLFSKSYAVGVGRNVIKPQVGKKLPAGTYVLHIKTSSESESKRIVKL